jgi:hypothetical protein
MALDPRLSDPVLLALAAMRAKQHQSDPPRRTVVLQVEYYDARGIDPPTLGERYAYVLPAPTPGGRAC